MTESTKGLYSWGQVVVGTLLGGPIAGSFFAAENVRHLGKPERAVGTFAWGFVAMVGLTVIGYFMPPQTSAMMLPAIYAGAYSQYIKHTQGSQLEAAFTGGTAKRPWWTVIGISLLCLFVVVLIFVAAAVAVERS